MALVSGFGPLEPFIGAEEGVALKDINGKYWSPIERGGIYTIECCKDKKDSWCKFMVEKVGDNKVRLRDIRGVYLSRIYRDAQYIEAAKSLPDICCEFQVFKQGDKVLFRSDNSQFLSTIYRGKYNIEAAKDGVDQYCEFSPVIGDIISPKFEIINVEFKCSPDVSEKPTVVKEESYMNRSSVDQKHKFHLSWTKSVSETTTWTHSWGLDATVSFNFLFVSTEIKVSYSGSYGTSSTEERTITMGEETEVTIPPKTKLIAKLTVNKNENAIVPFTATIKKTNADGQVKTFTEEGTWKGVIYENVKLFIEEEKLY